MIKLINKTIASELSGVLGGKDTQLSFLKYSTPNSGKNLDDKVIFLVFKSGAKEPFLCVKTVRNYSSKGRVVENFNSLKKLNELTYGSEHQNLFAKALYLYDDGENVFSIEPACKGRKTKLDERPIFTSVKRR